MQAFADYNSCIAIHGWGSHAFGGFKAHNDTYMWLRDSLAVDVPRLRVFTYGYASSPTADDSIAGVDDYADTFRRLLRSMRREYQTRIQTQRITPLVFIVHSFGGLVLKQVRLTIIDVRHLELNNPGINQNEE
jgi:hypothetical protein